jgi:hypothetical protein
MKKLLLILYCIFFWIILDKQTSGTLNYYILQDKDTNNRCLYIGAIQEMYVVGDKVDVLSFEYTNGISIANKIRKLD